MASNSSHHLYADILRWFVIAEGFAMLIVHLWTLLDLHRRGGPVKLRTGLALRWIGHVILTAGIAAFVIQRFGHSLNWWTPAFLIGYTLIATSVWLTRPLDPGHGLPQK